MTRCCQRVTIVTSHTFPWKIGGTGVVHRVRSRYPKKTAINKYPRVVRAQQDWEETKLETSEDESVRLKKRYSPSLKYNREEAIEMQLEALQNNNEPYFDHGIEVLYRFAGRHLDPFLPSNYFGRPLDLGQFERFRRIMNTECFRILVNHSSYEFLSSLQVSEHMWKTRVSVSNSFAKRQAVFEFNMVREFGGRYDGVWFCESLICDDDLEGRHIYGII